MVADSSLEGGSLDPSKYSKMSMEKKREFVYEISNWSNGASEMLQSWSRQEILQILCAEMGKERKYTGLTKLKIIEHLLKIVSEKKMAGNEDVIEIDSQSSPSIRTAKRQRKAEQPTRLATVASNGSSNNCTIDLTNVVFCKNSACRANLSKEDSFCKRCSCCVCHKYDDNKDPSLWLICNSEAPFQGLSCGMSCHLECAMKSEKSGIGLEGKPGAFDGSFQCLSCRKVNDLLGFRIYGDPHGEFTGLPVKMGRGIINQLTSGEEVQKLCSSAVGLPINITQTRFHSRTGQLLPRPLRCWRKQLLIAKETRRVDILCYRVSLSQKLLKGTSKYEKLHEIVEEAVKTLEGEVGELTGLPVKMGRGIVNRLSSGPEVQKLCSSALDLLDSMFSNNAVHSSADDPVSKAKKSLCPNMIKFEDVQTTSLAVVLDSQNLSPEDTKVYALWHRKSDNKNYPKEPTFGNLEPNTRFIMRGLSPATEYYFKVVSSDGTDTCEVLFSTSIGDEHGQSQSQSQSQSPATICSSLSNPSSVEDETNNDNRADDYLSLVACNETGNGKTLDAAASDIVKPDGKRLSEGQIEEFRTENGNAQAETGLEASLPITPCKLEMLKSKSVSKDLENVSGKGQNGLSDRDFEYYVKIIRWLECEGHIEKNFRQRFLTWYSLRATSQEVRIVKVFIDNFIEDPASLAGQLVDTFSETVLSKKSSVVPTGFCMKLWH